MYSCFHSVGLHKLPIIDVIRRSASAGYQAVELNAETLPWTGPHVTPETTDEERKAIVSVAAELGLTIPAVGAHIEMLDADPKAREAAIGYVNGCIDLARDLNSPIVHILSGPAAKGASEDETRRWFTHAVEKTVEYAEARGIKLAVEAIVGHGFRNTDGYHRLAKDLPGVNWYVNFDPSHLEVQGENPRRVVDELMDRIAHVHIKDGKGLYPDFSFPPMGEGTINFPELIDGLRNGGYDGALSIEYEAQVFGFERSDEEIVEGNRAYLKQFGV